MKVLFDTNILVAAFSSEGLCSKLLGRANLGDFELYLCPFILKELRRNLKIKIYLSKVEMTEVFSLLKEISIIVDPRKLGVRVSGVCRDEDDDNVIACALAANVDYIVTGDKDLLVLGSHKGIKIISPRQFELLFSKT